jgi:hypothetical protein
MQKLKSNHYKSLIYNTKRLKQNDITYIGFNINNLQDLKLENKLNIKDAVEFNIKGMSYINKINIKKSTLQYI